MRVSWRGQRVHASILTQQRYRASYALIHRYSASCTSPPRHLSITATPGNRNIQCWSKHVFLRTKLCANVRGSSPRRGGSFDRYIIHHYIKECSGRAPKIVAACCVRVLGWVRPPHSDLQPRPAPPMAYVLTLRCSASPRLAWPKHSRPTHLDVQPVTDQRTLSPSHLGTNYGRASIREPVLPGKTTIIYFGTCGCFFTSLWW